MFFAFPQKLVFDFIYFGKKNAFDLGSYPDAQSKASSLLTLEVIKFNFRLCQLSSTGLSNLIRWAVTESLLNVSMLKRAAYVHVCRMCFRRKWRIGHVYQPSSTLWPIIVTQSQQRLILMPSLSRVLAWEHSLVSICRASRTSLVSSYSSVSHGS